MCLTCQNVPVAVLVLISLSNYLGMDGSRLFECLAMPAVEQSVVRGTLSVSSGMECSEVYVKCEQWNRV